MNTTREKDELAAINWGIRERTDMARAFADGCAHRDRQVIAYLLAMAAEWDANGAHNMGNAVRSYVADIERGEHVTVRPYVRALMAKVKRGEHVR